MIVKKIDEYRSRYINNTETTVGVYELPGTKNERYITLKPKDEVIVKIKEKPVNHPHLNQKNDLRKGLAQ